MKPHVAVLSGGVGGAKLLSGLYGLRGETHVRAIVNTGDDFEHLGLYVSPDIDTAIYTLAGLDNRELGWGLEGETWNFMEALTKLGGPNWFRLGDRDLATHVVRTNALSAGKTLSAVVAGLAASHGIDADVLPMTDGSVRTVLDTDEGVLAFQDYFVARQCRPKVRAIRFEGAASCIPAAGVVDAIETAEAILIAPSNPFLSIAPILSVPGIRDAIKRSPAPTIAVSPLIGGKSVKGPTTKIMAELGLVQSDRAIIDHYGDLIDGILTDSSEMAPSGITSEQADILMRDDEDRHRVARAALDFARRLAR